jgi:hypothetical protein
MGWDMERSKKRKNNNQGGRNTTMSITAASVAVGFGRAPDERRRCARKHRQERTGSMKAIAEAVQCERKNQEAVEEVLRIFRDLKVHISGKLRKAGMLLCNMDRPTLRETKIALRGLGYAGEFVDRIMLAHLGKVPEWMLEKPALKVAGFVRQMEPEAIKRFVKVFETPRSKVDLFSADHPQQGTSKKEVEKLGYRDLQIILDAKKGVADPAMQARKAAMLERKKDFAKVSFTPVAHNADLEVRSATFDVAQKVLTLRLSNGEKAFCSAQILVPFKEALAL